MQGCLYVLVLCSLTTSAEAYKFLAYCPLLGKSHVNFMTKISDVLIDAGHEVVMLSEVYDTTLGEFGKSKARVIEIPQSARAKEVFEWANSGLAQDSWADQSVYTFHKTWSDMYDVFSEMFITTLSTPGLLDALRAEQFDAAYAESMHPCAPVLFHLLGIDKFAITESLTMFDGPFHYTQTPSNPSYVPSTMAARGGDNMTFLERLHNTYVFAIGDYFQWQKMHRFDRAMAGKLPGLPPLSDLIARNSLVFTNSEPLIDFPRPSSSRIIDIGGIVTWSSILDLRSRTILISFGSVAMAHLMPEVYKASIIETIQRFPNVTFIWKYERPEHNISRGIGNLIESTWVPQPDILRSNIGMMHVQIADDPRLTAFVTHCGQGSTTEAIDAGIPLIVIPVLGDQYRNAHQVTRNGIGIMLEKAQLGNPDPLTTAIRQVLSSYRERALQVRKMIGERPFTMRDIFVRYMEFLVAHGPLRQLDHFGRHLSFVQYYLIDVFAFVAGIVLVSLTIALVMTRWVLRAVLIHGPTLRVKRKPE